MKNVVADALRKDAIGVSETRMGGGIFGDGIEEIVDFSTVGNALWEP